MKHFELKSDQGEIAAKQLNALDDALQHQVYEFIGKLYQSQLEDDTSTVKITLKHNPETHDVQYSLVCHLSKAVNLIDEAKKVIEALSERYLDDVADMPEEQLDSPDESP